uniref:NACHT domain-containing protein n=1 Tax=Astyanax mexicanus TaxID=7994 RepID=A0A8B9JJK9_ASTMX
MVVFVKHELEMYRKLLRKENTNYYRKIKQTKWDLKQAFLNMTLSFLKKMKHDDVAATLQNELIGIIQRPLKEGMKKKYHHVCEGIAKQGESASLNSIYTDLYITEGDSGHVNKEHEVRRIEKNQMQQDVQIKCRTMFECLTEQDRPIRTVLTQGVAGVGKSVCVQKFILDWAEGEEHQDIQFIFPLPFRELNLKKGHHSLMDIISFFFPETKGLILTDQNKVMFILDGLDECKLPLSFQENEILHNVCKQASLDVVLTNLIKGNLLPSALIWITTRPAAASKIPAECVDRVSEVRGFNDQQKEEYFRKRISDQVMANKIVEHIKQSRSLFIMCHIPVFCWISATVLQKILEETESEETPKTLTNMYTCFLIFQAVQGNVKYSGKNAFDIPWDKEAILALGKLAFQQLEENNLIFYAGHLEACGIDPSKISVYSGLCTQETGRFLGTVFSFVHLSIQEFLAAVFAYISARNEHRNVCDPSQESKTTELIDFLKTAVDKALESDHGHLDLFLRFLLGLSLESNEKLIRGLLTQTGSSSDCKEEIVEYIKLKFKENPSPERSINLFYCLNELNDDSLVKEIQSYMSSGRLSEAELSPAQWSALVFVLLTSKEKLDEFDLKKFIRSEECLNRLLPVVKEAQSALLSECNLTERSCSSLLQVLSSECSTLTLLDLSNNPILDCGVELLSEGLKSSNCKLETLKLSDCNFSEKSCSVLLNVLNSEFTNLTTLDLSNNSIQDCGVEFLSEGLKSSNCKLEKLSLSFCSITGKGYESLSSALKSNSSSPLTELDLRGNNPGNSGVKRLTDLLEDPKWKLNKLRLLKKPAAEEAFDALSKTLGTNPLLQTELDLSGKIHGDSEIQKLSLLLEDLHCRTEKLNLINRSITEKGCSSLSEALCSNPSHLIELDLSENKLGNSGVEQLCALLANEHCNLEILRLSGCCITEEGYSALASALKSNPSSQSWISVGTILGVME